MPFIAPIAAALPGLIGASAPAWGPAVGAGITGKIFGAGGPSSGQQAAYDLMAGSIQNLTNQANTYSPFAQKFLTTANQGLGSAMNFWSPLLSGSRTAASSVLAPDINRVNEQYQGILDATQGSRTGAGASIYASAPYQKQAQIQSIFQALRPQAAQAMAGLGSQYGTLGSNTLSSVLNSLSNAVTGGQGLFDTATSLYDQEKEAGKTLQTLFGNIFSKLGSSE